MKDNDVKRIVDDLTKHYSSTKNPVNFLQANTFDDLMYRAGLTAQGCWDKMDQYDHKAILKFAELIVRECADIASINAHQYEPPGSYVLKHFGVKE